MRKAARNTIAVRALDIHIRDEKEKFESYP